MALILAEIRIITGRQVHEKLDQTSPVFYAYAILLIIWALRMLGKKVTVLGGTGFVGRAVMNELSQAGYEITLVVRRPERYREFALYPNTKVKQLDSFDDRETLVSLLEGRDVLVNLLADRSTGTEQIAQQDLLDVAKKIHSAMEIDHVSRCMTLSYLGANHDADSATWQGVLADFEAQMLSVPNCSATVMRAGLLVGNGDDTTTPFMKQLNRMPVLMMANSGTIVQPLWVKDFAKAMVNTIENAATKGQKIEVAGTEQMPLKRLGQMVAELMEQDDAIVFPMCKLNARLNAALGFMAPIVSVTKSQLQQIKGDAVTEAEFAELFGFAPASLDWVIAQYVQPKHVRERYNDYRKYANRD